jgi:formiminoglutamate deiminase
MKQYTFKGILQNEGWLENRGVTIDRDGIIVDIEQVNTNEVDTGYALPGFQNAHSHAFQYAMAGLAEKNDANATNGDFWSWREAMYRLALNISPDQLEDIAAMLYAEMVRHGYTSVAEFHYVHHDKNGKPYGNLAEMGSRLVAAAETAGINITLVPIFYQKGGFGVAPNERQKRFISSSVDDYMKLLDASQAACKHYNGANIAIGIHSMRGVEPEHISEIAQFGPQNLPFHIHISEQLKEIEDAVDYLGKRPVEWLAENVALSDRFHLVHATHLTDNETASIAQSGANVVLCPTTEGNLGDGIFPLRKYQELGGQWSIGTDSHVSLNPLEELRLLDYGQRLVSHKRDTFNSAEQGDSGLFAFEMASTGGRKAMNNFEEKFFEVGKPLNAIIYDDKSPLIGSTSIDNMASTILYSSDASMQQATIINGKEVVTDGQHYSNESISNKFFKTIKELENR